MEKTLAEQHVETTAYARIATPGECRQQIDAQSKRLGDEGVMEIVFRDAATLAAWRIRVAALTKLLSLRN